MEIPVIAQFNVAWISNKTTKPYFLHLKQSSENYFSLTITCYRNGVYMNSFIITTANSLQKHIYFCSMKHLSLIYLFLFWWWSLGSWYLWKMWAVFVHYFNEAKHTQHSTSKYLLVYIWMYVGNNFPCSSLRN